MAADTFYNDNTIIRRRLSGKQILKVDQKVDLEGSKCRSDIELENSVLEQMVWCFCLS